MCELYSWIEKDGEALFLTPYDVFDTQRGRELQKHTPNHKEDWHGHGAIRWYYEVTGGIDRECTDFSSPENFPPDLAKAIKQGRMWGFGITEQMHVMLQQTALAEYKKVEHTAWVKYLKIQKTAMMKYLKIQQTAWAKYLKVQQTALAEYQKTEQPAWAEYLKVEQPAWAEYKTTMRAAWSQLWQNRINAWR